MYALQSPLDLPILIRHPQGLLDFSKEFDVSLLDKVAMAFYTSRGQEVRRPLYLLPISTPLISSQQQMAQHVLTQLEEHPDAWTRVPEIMEKSTFQQSKVFTSLSAHYPSHPLHSVYRSADSRETHHHTLENSS